MDSISIRDRFSAIKDTRHQSYVEHDLSNILIIVMCAVLCGVDQLEDIVIFGEERLDFFKKEFLYFINSFKIYI